MNKSFHILLILFLLFTIKYNIQHISQLLDIEIQERLHVIYINLYAYYEFDKFIFHFFLYFLTIVFFFFGYIIIFNNILYTQEFCNTYVFIVNQIKFIASLKIKFLKC